MALDSNKKIGELFEIAQLLSLFIILIGLFFGSMFAFDNYFITIPVSFGLVILLYKLLEILINKRMERNRASVNLGASALWALFVVCAIPTNILIIHMFNVEFFEKQAIKDVGNNKIACLEDLQRNYTASYNSFLTSKKNNLIADLTLYNAGSLNKDVVISNNKITSEEIDLIDRSTPLNMELSIDSSIINPIRQKFVAKNTSIFGTDFQNYISVQRNNIEQFKHFQQNKTLNDLNLKLEKTRDSILPFLKTETGQAATFSNVCLDENSLITSPMKLFFKQLGFYTLIILLLTNGLLLLPYFLSPKKVFRSSGGGINNVKTFD